jgi:hypothetical protein
VYYQASILKKNPLSFWRGYKQLILVLPLAGQATYGKIPSSA